LERAFNFGNRRILQEEIIKLRTSRYCTELLCIEPVIQRERWKAFCAKAHEIQRDSSHDAQLMYEIAFHGTRVEDIPKIVKNGFLVPQRRGDQGGSGHRSANGAKFGLGIYCGPNITSSRSYGKRLFMCAVAMGKTYPCEIPIGMKDVGLKPGFDSHKCSGDEWVVFLTRDRLFRFVYYISWS
jgi:Poly(ADP-ribose) polymerase catalytic domain